MTTGPMSGLRVYDASTGVAGPHCTSLMALSGAEVIKVEAPSGDSARNMPPFVNGQSAPFMTWNRNKRSIALDLKQPASIETVLELAARADALIEGFRPGVTERLGIGPDECLARQPALIYGRITNPRRDQMANQLRDWK